MPDYVHHPALTFAGFECIGVVSAALGDAVLLVNENVLEVDLRVDEGYLELLPDGDQRHAVTTELLKQCVVVLAAEGDVVSVDVGHRHCIAVEHLPKRRRPEPV